MLFIPCGDRAMPSTEFGGNPATSQSNLPLTKFGTIDITDGVPDHLIHVDLPRLGPTCKRLGIEYGKAIVSWNEFGRRRIKKSYPVFSGVVIRTIDYDRLQEAMETKAQKHHKSVNRLPVLAALFTLNRRAKRCRDLAQTYYQNGMHGLAGDMKREKDRIYDLKGQVLHHSVEAGVLAGGNFHQFEFGNWAEVLEGSGYRFHRPCPPRQDGSQESMIESVEAKPKESKEPTLGIAYEVIENFLQGKKQVKVYEWPRKPRPSRSYKRHDEDDVHDEFSDDGLDDDDEEEL